MAKLEWGVTHERCIENGVKQVVVYPMNGTGSYDPGISWTGVAGITMSPTGAERTSIFADDRRYLNLYSVEELGMTIDAFTMPDEFKHCNGIITVIPGVDIRQQDRQAFGLCYRTNIGDDTSDKVGYKLHLIYSALSLMSELVFSSQSDATDPTMYAFELTTLPVHVTGLKPAEVVIINSLVANKVRLKEIENILYGDSDHDPRLPFPEEIVAILTIGYGRYDVARSDYDACYYT